MVFDAKNLTVDERNRLKTHNHMGFAHITPLKATKDLYDFAQTHGGFYADIGAAYGVDTMELLLRGAHVLAIDPDPSHLDFLKNQVDLECQSRLETRCQYFPQDVDLETNYYDGILLSRVLIFLTPDQLEDAFAKLYQALKPGGRVYIISVSPFSEKWDAVKEIFHEHKNVHPNQPLYLTNLWDLLPFTQSFLPPAIQLFDQDCLIHLLVTAGFQMLECGYENHHGTEDVYAIALKKR